MREPRRAALGLLYAIVGDGAVRTRPTWRRLPRFTPARAAPCLRRMLARGVNAPVTSSAGRLFDAVASLAGLRQQLRFEGQAAMELEFALDGVETDEAYPFRSPDGRRAGELRRRRQIRRRRLGAAGRGRCSTMCARASPVGAMSARFHNALAEAIVGVARRVGEPRVVLTGGCFQNRYLTERAVARLRGAGFRPYWHQRVPPNDGGIALGQVAAVRRGSAVGQSVVADRWSGADTYAAGTAISGACPWPCT